VYKLQFLWSPYGIGQTIILSSYFFLLSSSSFLFPRLISAVRDWMSTIGYFHTWCGLSANLECRYEMCCMWLAAIQDAKMMQKTPSGRHHPRTLSGYVFATKACIDNRKKLLSSSNISSTCAHNMVNFGPVAAEIVSGVWGTPGNFNGYRVLAALLHGM